MMPKLVEGKIQSFEGGDPGVIARIKPLDYSWQGEILIQKSMINSDRRLEVNDIVKVKVFLPDE